MYTVRRSGLALALACTLTPCAWAANLYSGDGLDIRWDNTLRYSAGMRLAARNPVLLALPNGDDGDRAFAPGSMMSNRLDLVSVLNIASGEFGLQAGIAAWYDTVYQTRTDNRAAATFNAVSVPPDRFTAATRKLNGQYADLGETFVYGNFLFADMPVSFRAGRQTLLWGESLFFAQNGIAAAMAPVDIIRTLGTPDGYSSQAFLPVGQISLTAQPAAGISFSAYYQFEGRATRLPGVGSYFSDRDVLGTGAERALLPGGNFLVHGRDERHPAGGQFGFALHMLLDETDLGLYALHANARYPVLTAYDQPSAPHMSGYVGQFHSIYPADIEIYAASFSTYAGDVILAGEISGRRNAPLQSFPPVTQYSFGPLRIVSGDGYARGDTLHAQLSSVATLSRGTLWHSADLSVEIAANQVLAITHNPAAFWSNRNDWAAASARALFKPRYFEILPNLDGALIFGLGYNLAGRSSTDYTQNAATGDFELGVAATYLTVWKADLVLTSFFGSPTRQTLADRDLLMLRLENTL
jgi:hypothetical protein